jgi:16S rRNA (cytidine1402-2'-O)-methyltransferase
VSELAAHYRDHAARGEVTVVIGPAEQDDPEDLDGQLRTALAGNSVKDAAALVAAATGLPRKLVYARALALAAHQEP